MQLKDITPFVRMVGHFFVSTDSADAFRSVKTRDNRLFYITEGTGSFRIGGALYAIGSGSCVMIRAGQDYCIEPDSTVKLIVVNFDFTDRYRTLSKSFHPFSTDFPGILEEMAFEDCPMLASYLVEPNAERLKQPLLRMVNEFLDSGPWRDEYLSAAMKTILIDIVRGRQDELCEAGGKDYTVREVIGYLRENYAEPIDSETLSRVFHFTSGYINRLFKREVGVSIHQYLITLRVNVAKKLLASGEYSPSEAAELIGFKDYPHFSKTFKRLTGRTPSQYRASSHE